MFSRVVPRALLASKRVAAPRRMGSHAAFKPESQVALEHRSRISDIPVPAGSWQEYHNKRNAKWNMYLAASVVFFGVTFVATLKGNVWLLHDIGDVRKVKIDPS